MAFVAKNVPISWDPGHPLMRNPMQAIMIAFSKPHYVESLKPRPLTSTHHTAKTMQAITRS